MAVDGALAVAAAIVAYQVRFRGELPLPAAGIDRYRVATLGVVVSWVLLARSTGLYRRAALKPGTSNVGAAARAAALVGVALLLADRTAFRGELSRGWVVLVVLELAVAGVGSRALLRRALRRGDGSVT